MTTPDTLHAQLVAAVEAEKTQARTLLRYAQENDLMVRDPKHLGRFMPGWHQWPDIIRSMELLIRHCDADLRRLERHRPVVESEAAGLCKVAWHENWPCSDFRDIGTAYGVVVDGD